MARRMDLTRKLFQRSVLDRIDETDWDLGNAAPYVVELDPTAACDLACPGCISQDLIAIGNRFSDDRLMGLGNEFIRCGVRAVILIGGGEPLTHPKIGDFIELLGANDIHIGITTNGTLIHRHIDPISAYSKWTRVSMDAATDGMFDMLRPSKGGKSKFARIVENMRQLARSKTGKLGYSYLIQTKADGLSIDSNVHEIYDAALLARDIGCDYFEVKPTYRFRDDVPHALMRHDPVLMQRAREQIERLDALETDDFRILKAINLEFSLKGDVEDQPKDYKACPSAHLRTTVTPGGVYVCPYWRGKHNMRIGDASETSFADMWSGEERMHIMRRLDASVDCYFHCLRHETNRACFEIKERMESSGEIIEADGDFDRFI
uniref:Radical SAM superfamily enzyme, MoaA/NifB/PqqE/SkfB family n=1 Tax=Candidatus Kentrum sp. TC TaxID=2126339 RepID=A0A450ZS42_9GAMM|nr:MAG: Radical SAM superfamily enzyme, MoaA/NifB/PqqE/SkfB family [Candidatus Kentron sp. TC]VFK56599.1 MAG: Radical SAM superfamily enzyme, MoaA/NifB/PqqE/SkfB family [Candidatus Kentron sp. TC]